MKQCENLYKIIFVVGICSLFTWIIFFSKCIKKIKQIEKKKTVVNKAVFVFLIIFVILINSVSCFILLFLLTILI